MLPRVQAGTCRHAQEPARHAPGLDSVHESLQLEAAQVQRLHAGGHGFPGPAHNLLQLLWGCASVGGARRHLAPLQILPQLLHLNAVLQRWAGTLLIDQLMRVLPWPLVLQCLLPGLLAFGVPDPALKVFGPVRLATITATLRE